MLSKQETLQYKGIAILIMIFLHLFNVKSNLSLCDISLYLLGEPLVFQIVKFTFICVPLYLFLSGYGLYISYSKSYFLNPFKRIFKLYLNFWIVCLIFIPLAVYLRPEYYSVEIGEIIKNITGWHTTYNYEWWFLFPYMLLVFTSNIIFKLVRSVNFLILLLSVTGLYLLFYIITYFLAEKLSSNHYIYILISYLNCLPYFVLGAIFVKYDLFSALQRKVQITTLWKNILWICFFLFLLFCRAVSSGIVNIIVLVLFICWFAVLKKNRIFIFILEKLGKQSTNMWLVHTFFCYYLFHDWIYGLKYPIVIFVVTVMLSYLTGILIDRIYQPLQKVIIEK